MSPAPRRRLLPKVLVAALLPFLSPPTAAEVPGLASIQREAGPLIQDEMRKGQIPGLSTALVEGDRVLWAQGFGEADAANRVPAGPETLYRVGSITKLFTATALARLAEQGRLSLDDPLVRHLPGLDLRSDLGPVSRISLRQVLSHHGGLPANRMAGMWSQDPALPQSLVANLAGDWLAYPPGEVFYYSNAGYGLAGLVVEAATGQGYADWMGAHLLRPLGMGSAVLSQAVPQVPAMAKGYLEGRESPDPPLRDIAAGGLVASVLDLSRFVSMVLGSGRAADGTRILSERALAEMLSPQNPDCPLDGDLRIGLGWMLSGLEVPRAGRVVHHAGGTLRHSSQLVVLPDAGLGVVVLTNSASGGEGAARIAIRVLGLALAARAGETPTATAPPALADRPLDASERAPYLGDWTTEVGLVQVRAPGGRLQADALGKTFRLEPRVDGRLAVRYRLLGLIPVDLGEIDRIGLKAARIGGRDALSVRQGSSDLVLGTRLAQVPIPDPWQARVGDYQVANLGADAAVLTRVSLKIRNGHLIAEIGALGETGTVPLKPIDDHQALAQGRIAGYGERLVAVDLGGTEVLRFSGYDLRRVGAAPARRAVR